MNRPLVVGALVLAVAGGFTASQITDNEAAREASSAPVSSGHYAVEAGETYRIIAPKVGVTEQELACANRTSSTSCPSVTAQLGAGRVIHVPPVAPTTTTGVPSSTTSTNAATTTTAPSATTTTSVAPTTTAASTTSSTAAPTTTSSPTSTTISTPPGGFTENFTTAAGFYDRFDFGMSGFHPTVDPNYTRHWEGDHNLGCQGAATSRDVVLGPDKQHLDSLFWHCAPGGPDTGHIMTSITPQGYVYLWFSPKQYLNNVRSVCWDQNSTMMGGRKWVDVTISARAEVERVISQEGHLDLGFSSPGFQTIGGPTTEIIPTDLTVGVGFSQGFASVWQGDHEIQQNALFDQNYKIEDVATRYRHCFIDNGNGTLTLKVERGEYSGAKVVPVNSTRTIATATVPGSFPDGEVRVTFVDANYNPEKDAEYDPGQNTWHFDNVTIEAG